MDGTKDGLERMNNSGLFSSSSFFYFCFSFF